MKFSNYLVRIVGPSYPGTQRQLKASTRSAQVAPFRQGEEEHSFISIKGGMQRGQICINHNLSIIISDALWKIVWSSEYRVTLIYVLMIIVYFLDDRLSFEGKTLFGNEFFQQTKRYTSRKKNVQYASKYWPHVHIVALSRILFRIRNLPTRFTICSFNPRKFTSNKNT